MGKNNKNKINIFFCINSLQKGGAEKQLNYISNFLSTNYNIFIFTLAGNKNYYKFNKNIKIYKLFNILMGILLLIFGFLVYNNKIYILNIYSQKFFDYFN